MYAWFHARKNENPSSLGCSIHENTSSIHDAAEKKREKKMIFSPELTSLLAAEVGQLYADAVAWLCSPAGMACLLVLFLGPSDYWSLTANIQAMNDSAR